MKINFKFVSLLIILLFMSVSLVAASDSDNQTLMINNNEDMGLSVNDAQNYDLSVDESAQDNYTAGTGTFTELQKLIWASKAGDTIVLDKDYEVDSALVRQHIIIDRTLTIDGNGHTLDGKDTKRIFYIEPQSTNTVLKNINFVNGYHSQGGSAIFWRADNGILTECTFTDNIANQNGGAVYWGANNGTATYNVFKNNKAGVEKLSTYQSGGAIYWEGNYSEASNNRFLNNFALTNGGAITWKGSDGILKNNVFISNLGLESGGAIYWDGSGALMNNNTFDSNAAELSGGALYYEAENGVVSNNNFIKNTAKTNAGAIRWNGNGGTVTDSYFESNSATLTGGAIYWEGTKGKLTNNEFIKNNADVSAGAVMWNANSATLDDNIYRDNTAKEYGGAVYFKGNDSSLTNSEFKNNKASKSGAAVYWEGDSGQVSKNTFEDSISSSGSGGAIKWSGSNGAVSENNFKNSQAVSGGAIYWDGANGKLLNNNFTKSTASKAGGAVYWNSNGAEITGNRFDGSTTTSDYGGAIYFNGASSKINNNIFTNNKASKTGGAIYYNGNGNTANYNIFTSNAAQSGSGGAIRWNGNSATLIGNTFEDNTATYTGNSIYGEGDNGQITKNTFFNSEEGQQTIDWRGNNNKISDNTYGKSRETKLAMADLTLYYGASGKLVITLTDKNSKPLAKKDILLTFNGKDTQLSTDANGKAEYEIKDLTVGTYKATAKFAGDAGYDASQSTATVTYKTTIEAKDLTAEIGNVNYNATFFDTNGKPLAKGEYVSFTVEGDVYRVQVGDNGVATATFDKRIGEYSIRSTNTVTGETVKNNLKIMQASTIITVNNLTFYYSRGEKLNIALTDKNSKPLAKKDIVLTINGKNTQLSTDENGKAEYMVSEIDVGEKFGTYDATVKFAGDDDYSASQATATVTYKTTLISDDLTAQYGNVIYNATFLSEKGTPLIKGSEVTFIIDNNEFKGTVGNNGVATATIDLSSGEYNIKSYNPRTGESATNKLKITKASSKLTINNVTYYYESNGNLVIKLTDESSKPLAEKNIVLTINGKDKKLLTDSKGESKYSITIFDIEEYGTFKTIVKFAGDENYTASQATGTATHKITVIAEDLTAEYGKGIYNATFLMEDGSPVSGYTARFEVGPTYFLVQIGDNGVASLALEYQVVPGDYTIISHNPITGESSKNKLKILKTSPNLNVKTNDISEGEDAIFNLTVNVHGASTVTLSINNNKYEKLLMLGTGQIIVSNLTAGEYPYTVTYPENENFNEQIISGTLNVKSDSVIITAPDVSKYYGGVERLTVKLTDKTGAPLANKNIYITINGGVYEKTTDSQGETSIGLNLPSKNYTATIVFKGDGDYKAVNTTCNVEIKTTIFGADITKIEKAPEPYSATCLDKTGKVAAKGTGVIFNINGVFYTRQTDEKGIVNLNLNLEKGTYIITATNTVTGESTANTITIKSRFANANDVTKYYRNDTQYSITVLDDNGNPVKAGESVTFNINGVFYTRQTDANGTAKMNINLQQGDYIITAIYKNCMVSNKIKVLPVLSAKNITKKYGEATPFVANLVDGQGKAFANQTIIFNINGVFYNRITDDSGNARLNINLMPGIYIITSMYNGGSIANRVTIRA